MGIQRYFTQLVLRLAMSGSLHVLPLYAYLALTATQDNLNFIKYACCVH
jgi:hypothetical protein